MVVAAPAAAQTIVTSDRIDAVSVTVYREPTSQSDARAMRRAAPDWPGGYALITETRTIRLPAGRSVIRFEGVSQGMLPESAIVTGLPRQVVEKNRDARLLSPAALVDAHLKRRVTVRRTNRATGAVREQDAVIQSGPGGGVLLTTADGVEALGCSGLPETMVYPGVPADLSARPTLSVVADSTGAATATIQLSYLAEGLDWSASYVARVAEDGETLDLFAWATIVNGGSEGFAGARTQTVAGLPNREAKAPQPRSPAPELRLQCWPMDITSTHPRRGQPVPPPPPPAPMTMDAMGAEEIVVTAQRRQRGMLASPVAVMVAEQEELGDLKLYRIPEPVTVAAQSRKQVAMIDRKRVRFERVYGAAFESFELPDYADENQPGPEAALLVLRTENKAGQGLGLPLPAGAVSIFEDDGTQSLLVGEDRLDDRAIGDEVELAIGRSPEVQYRLIAQPRRGKRQSYEARVTNAKAVPVTFELAIPYQLASASETLGRRKGQASWRATVPANGEAKLRFTLKLERE